MPRPMPRGRMLHEGCTKKMPNPRVLCLLREALRVFVAKPFAPAGPGHRDVSPCAKQKTFVICWRQRPCLSWHRVIA
jgi:hypothetical protein